MRICFIGKQTVKSFLEGYNGEQADLFLFGFNGMGEVRYEEELNGKTKFFEQAALLSKKTQALVVSGLVTDMRGHKRKSAVIAEKGKLKGVSDALYSLDEKTSCGANLRVYETGMGKMGVAVAQDLHFPEIIKTLSDCGSDFIVCPYGNMRNHLPTTLLKANGYFYGTPILFCSDGYAMMANGKGELLFSTPASPFITEFAYKAEYRLIQSRKKGL